MKNQNTCKKILTLLLALCTLCMFAACNDVDATGLWENATHLSEKTFGDGAVTITVEVKAGEQTLTFTVHTDETMLDNALMAHELIAGEEGAYGWYVTAVNGMPAEGNTYWALYIDGEYAMVGVSQTPVTAGTVYTFAHEAF